MNIVPIDVIDDISRMSLSSIDTIDCITMARASCSVSAVSNCICKSAPFWAFVVLSSTRVPVCPCTAASVTIDKVSRRIRDNRLTDWLDPEPLKPRRMSEIAGDQPISRLRI